MTTVSAHVPDSPVKAKPRQRAYADTAYLGSRLERLHSYRVQLDYALRSTPATALVAGTGDGIVVQLLRKAGVSVTTLDVNAELEPDVVASVESIPLPDRSVDVAICCQVLEHLPFDRFTVCLRELRRVTSSRLVLSVPDVRRFLSLRMSIPRLELDWQLSMPRLRPPSVSPERFAACPHYWEIGFSGTGYGTVRRRIVEAGWSIRESRRVADLSWHCFFYCA